MRKTKKKNERRKRTKQEDLNIYYLNSDGQANYKFKDEEENKKKEREKRIRENKNEYRGRGSWKGGWYFFLGVWFLFSGWVTVEVWNAVRQRVGMGGWPKARSKDISQRAQSPRATSSSVRTGPWDGMQSWPPPNTSVLVPKVSSSPWVGRQT